MVLGLLSPPLIPLAWSFAEEPRPIKRTPEPTTRGEAGGRSCANLLTLSISYHTRWKAEGLNWLGKAGLSARLRPIPGRTSIPKMSWIAVPPWREAQLLCLGGAMKRFLQKLRKHLTHLTSSPSILGVSGGRGTRKKEGPSHYQDPQHAHSDSGSLPW